MECLVCLYYVTLTAKTHGAIRHSWLMPPPMGMKYSKNLGLQLTVKYVGAYNCYWQFNETGFTNSVTPTAVCGDPENDLLVNIRHLQVVMRGQEIQFLFHIRMSERWFVVSPDGARNDVHLD